MQITELTPRERALLARRMRLDADVDDATLAAFIGAELQPDRADRIRRKQAAIARATRRVTRASNSMPPAQQLDPSGAYPADWLKTPPPQHGGRVRHLGGGRVTFAP